MTGAPRDRPLLDFPDKRSRTGRNGAPHVECYLGNIQKVRKELTLRKEAAL